MTFFQVYAVWSWQRWYAVLWYGFGWSLGDSSRRMVGLAGGFADVVQSTGTVELAVAPDRNLVSVVGRDFQNTPLILSIRRHLESIKRLVKGDQNIGCGCRQRSSGPSKFANPFKVAQHGRERAIQLFSRHLERDKSLRSALWTLSGLRLVCHCALRQSCHADALISAYSDEFPEALNREETSPVPPPTSLQHTYLAELREELDSRRVKR